MNYKFDKELAEVWKRPVRGRPIIGCSVRNQINELNFQSFNDLDSGFTRNLCHTFSTSGSEGADSCVDSFADFSPIVSPIGSPLNSWPLSVNPSKRQSVTKSLFFEDNSNDSKLEFEANGREVPIDREIWRSSMGWKPRDGQVYNQYQLFGTNGFNYAEMKPVIGQKSKPLDTGFKPKAKRRQKTQTFCSFCKNNNETPECYNSHVVKDPTGRTVCPILRALNCPKCLSGGGDNGHTIRYCPLNKPDSEKYIPSVIKLLKSSRSADGRKRNV